MPLDFKLDLLLLGQIILLIVELYVHFFKFNQFFLLLAFPPTNFILYYFIYLLDLEVWIKNRHVRPDLDHF